LIISLLGRIKSDGRPVGLGEPAYTTWVAAPAGTVAKKVEIMANPAKSAKAGMVTIRVNVFILRFLLEAVPKVLGAYQDASEDDPGAIR
jgi:hypothetical protein